MTTAEQLDEDMLAHDPMDEAVEPANDRSVAPRTGTTVREQREGAPLGERLGEEEPDISG